MPSTTPSAPGRDGWPAAVACVAPAPPMPVCTLRHAPSVTPPRPPARAPPAANAASQTPSCARASSIGTLWCMRSSARHPAPASAACSQPAVASRRLPATAQTELWNRARLSWRHVSVCVSGNTLQSACRTMIGAELFQQRQGWWRPAGVQQGQLAAQAGWVGQATGYGGVPSQARGSAGRGKGQGGEKEDMCDARKLPSVALGSGARGLPGRGSRLSSAGTGGRVSSRRPVCLGGGAA